MVLNKSVFSVPAFRKTRIAPTPSGYLHIGNVLSFAITAAIAERTGAKIFLRIDDLDRERTTQAFVQDVFDTLNFLDIPWHEGPRTYAEYLNEYSQVHREHLYNKALEQLWDAGHVFACTCSRSQILEKSADGSYPGICRDKHLPPDTPGACWRLRTDRDATLTMRTLNGIAEMPFPQDMSDFVIKRKDGLAAYQLTSVIDDTLFGIDLVVRGEDLLHSTLAQLYLANVLEISSFLQTTFHHHPLVSGINGLKLSKSAGATSIQHLRNQYKTREAVLNVIAEMLCIKTDVRSWREFLINI